LGRILSKQRYYVSNTAGWRDYFVELIDVTLRRETIESNDTGDPTTPKKGDVRRVTDALCTARGSSPCEQRMVAYLFAIFIARRPLRSDAAVAILCAFFFALRLPTRCNICTRVLASGNAFA
jgi:hypothetical protein